MIEMNVVEVNQLTLKRKERHYGYTSSGEHSYISACILHLVFISDQNMI